MKITTKCHCGEVIELTKEDLDFCEIECSNCLSTVDYDDVWDQLNEYYSAKAPGASIY